MAKQVKRESVKMQKVKNEKVPILAADLTGDDEELESMDDVYEALQNEFDQVRKCIGMYISYTKEMAGMHLMKEIVHNAFDEFSSGKVPFNNVYVSFDEPNQTFTIRDEGRGIPFAKLKDVCTKKHVSTKYERSETMKRFAGRNGVGMKVTVALCDFFKITSNRNTVSQTIMFDDGEPTVEPVKQLKNINHGLEVQFKPSEKYLGRFHITLEMVEDYFRRMAYIMPEDLTLVFKGIDKDGHKRNINYKAQGLRQNVQFLTPNLDFSPIDMSIESPDFDIDFSFCYDRSTDEMKVESYCNYVHTTEGGTHETAVIRALAEFFTKEADKLDPDAKYKVTQDDCKKGLVLAIAGWHYDPGFEGQHKSKVNNDDFVSTGKIMIKEALAAYFQRNNALLRKIVSLLRKNVQVRMEAVKIKGPKIQKMKNAIDYMGIEGFEDITDPNYSVASELLIAEGVSAVGAIKNIRNRKFQAVYGVMGVVDNVCNCSLARVMQMPVFANLVKILGCGIGPTFNIQNLRFKKIIILVDTDCDGSNIASLLLVFFCTFYPELIEQGYIYKAISPLYKIDTYPIQKYYKGNYWLYSKRELYDVFNEIVVNNINLGFYQGKEFVELTKAQKKKFLELNSEYLMEYDMLLSRTSGHPYVTEYVAYYKYLYKNNLEKFKKALEKKFPEIHVDILNQSITGSYEGEAVSLLIDSIFDYAAKRIMTLLAENEFFEFFYSNKNDKEPIYKETTIYNFFKEMRGIYKINVLQRFKGLGEAGDDLLFITTINPTVRRLIRFTVKDMKETLDMLTVYHGKKDSSREARRNIMTNNVISFTDIDN